MIKLPYPRNARGLRQLFSVGLLRRMPLITRAAFERIWNRPAAGYSANALHRRQKEKSMTSMTDNRVCRHPIEDAAGIMSLNNKQAFSHSYSRCGTPADRQQGQSGRREKNPLRHSAQRGDRRIRFPRIVFYIGRQPQL